MCLEEHLKDLKYVQGTCKQDEDGDDNEEGEDLLDEDDCPKGNF